MTGLGFNIAELQRENHYMTIAQRQRAKIHPSSVLSGKPKTKCILYTELMATGQRYMRTVTAIEPEWIEEVIPNHMQMKRLFNGSSLTNGTNGNGISNGLNGSSGKS